MVEHSLVLEPCEIDNYAEDGGPGKSDFYVVFTMSLCAFAIKQTLIALLFEVARL